MNSFNKEKHEYLINGTPATGVTSVIGVLAKPALIQWAANEAIKYVTNQAIPYYGPDDNGDALEDHYIITGADLQNGRTAHAKKKDKAATHGTDTHALVENWVGLCLKNNDGKPIFLEGETLVASPIEKFILWANDSVSQFLFSERQMYNEEMFIAGTADFGVIMKDGKKLIGDFKTSSGVYGIDYFLQCAGYKVLAEGEGDEPYDGCVIVRLGKDGSFDVYYSYDSRIEEEAFRACLTIYRAQATFKEFKELPEGVKQK